jgi:hypothetical protein
LIVCISFIQAQTVAESVELVAEYNIVNGTSSDFDLKTDIDVINNSSTSFSLKAAFQVVQLSEGDPYFCWDVCYNVWTEISSGELSLEANSTDVIDGNGNTLIFSGHYRPNGSYGLTQMKYCVFQMDDMTDSVCVNVNFDVTNVSIDEIDNSIFSEFYPNPSSSKARINISLLKENAKAEIILIDMLGNKVSERSFNDKNGVLDFDLSSINPGLYFANIIVDDELNTIKKLIVAE